MGAVAGRAIHFPFEHGMVMGTVKFYFFIGVALKAGCHIPFGIQDVSFSPAGIYVKAGRTVAHFTALNLHSFTGNAHT